jgi:hypothetical protein
MSTRIVLAVYSDHIQGYGFLSDLLGNTDYMGVSRSITKRLEIQGYQLESQFIINPIIPCYEVENKKIPCGTLVVTAVKL